MVLTIHYGDSLGVVECHQVLTAQGDAVQTAIAGLKDDVGRAARLIDNACHRVSSTWIAIEDRNTALSKNLYKGWLAIGDDTMGLGTTVITIIAHKWVIGTMSISINRLNIDSGPADILPSAVEEADVEGVVMFIQASAYPVEVDQLTVFMSVKMESCRQTGGAKVWVKGDSRMQTGLVEPQLAVTILQKHILQRLTFVHIEALEGLALQLQGLALHLTLTLRTGKGDDVLQAVGLACQLSLGVKLEGVEVVVIPVVDVVFKPDGVLLSVHGPDLYLHRHLLTGHVDIEITADTH